MPISQISNSFKKPSEFIGRKLKVRVIECDRRKRKLIVSRKFLSKKEKKMDKRKYGELAVGEL